MNICKNCSKNFEPKKGLTSYCSFDCRAVNRIIIVDYVCMKCDENFTSKKIREGRNIHCSECKRKVNRVKEGESILEFSFRTVAKILKKANVPCQNCGYCKASRDVHHIKQKKDGGGNENENLIVLCPNCHREAHEDFITLEFLKSKSIDKTFPNYKEYYHLHEDGSIRK